MRVETLVLTGRVRAKEVPPARAAAVSVDEAVDVPAFGTGEWLFGTRLAVRTLPAWLRPFSYLYLRLMGGPPCYPTARATFTTRERARANCTSPLDWIMWIPKDSPLGAELEAPRFMCEPLNDAERDAEHAALFAFEEAEARELRTLLTAMRDELRAAATSPPEVA